MFGLNYYAIGLTLNGLCLQAPTANMERLLLLWSLTNVEAQEAQPLKEKNTKQSITLLRVRVSLGLTDPIQCGSDR